MRGNKGLSVKLVVLLLAVVLLIGGTVGGTLAWLMAKSKTVTNTFTTSNVSIELEETERTYKMVPGVELPKDPKVTVLEGSEACWLFVKIVETEGSANQITNGNADSTTYIKYTVAEDWTELTGVDGVTGVYYRKHAATPDANGTPISVLKDDKVTVPNTVTKAMMEAEDLELKLSFTAYAVQQEGFDTAAAAWAQASTLDNNS